MTGPLSRLGTFALAAAIAAGACASTTPAAPTDVGPAASTGPSPASAPSTSAATDPAATPASASPKAPASPDPGGATIPELSQPWATATLTDVETGEAFRIADFAGRTVFVEAMAIWCSNCRRQQGEFTAALERLDPEAVAYVVLTVEPSESADALARYESDQGFDGRYAVAGRDVSAALEAEFGPTVLSPPNVPVIVIRPDGSIEFRTGQHGADDIVAVVEG
jgi:thiol-disulfide isomerase/thioredoxin